MGAAPKGHHRFQVRGRRPCLASGIRKKTTPKMIECDTCTASFHSRFSCNQHMTDKGHWGAQYECSRCDRSFRTREAMHQHMDNVDHDARHECEMCDRCFRSERAASQHMDAVDHWEPPNYCRGCGKEFGSENELKMHRNSRTHRGRNVPCPYCERDFTTASGVAHHVETGSCPKADDLDRFEVLHNIRQRDPFRVITVPPWQCESGSEAQAEYNPYRARWECSFCDREFHSMAAAKAHALSPVHRAHVYRCPNGAQGCERTFVTLAGLFAHLESESCGFLDFDEVQAKAIDVLYGPSRVDFN